MNTKNIADHARKVIIATKEANDSLSFSILAMFGALLSKNKSDDLDLSRESLYLDPDPGSMNEARILSLFIDDETGELMYQDDVSSEPEEVINLPFNSRIELAERMADMLD